MILIKPDKNRRIAIPGVSAPVERPVDIDQARTGFASLRTLRIYRFETDAVIEGHAEEDEVFIVVLSGSVELTMFENLSIANNPQDHVHPVTLSAPEDEHGVACAAYLPPGAAYKLIAKVNADVAYARATPSSAPPAKVFFSSARAPMPSVSVLLEVTNYAARLRLRLVKVDARQTAAVFTPFNESEGGCEALIHVRTIPLAGAATIRPSGGGPPGFESDEPESNELDSWDTVSVAPGDRPTLHIATGCSALALLVLAD